ncbi:glycoside hydrolase family 105 protein [Paenibacillus sp. sgz5001063]|uniref:glycoside hydrolase family 88/105 protein n=1 Tax=Paenibacillus sp. sgz5001063 TaxID=3242474 RepID=UPI0036D3A357
MNTERKLAETLDLLFQYMTSEEHQGHWGMDIEHWDWVPGVGVISLMEYAAVSGEEKVLDYLLLWVNRNKRKADGVKVINSLAPFAIFPELYRLTEDPWLLQQALSTAGWMLNTAPVTREGALEHTVTENVDFPEQVWADTVYMAVLFLARLGGITGDSRLADAALQQTLLHMQLLQDPATGLMYHGWNSREGHHMSAVRWARANAWITLAVPQIVTELQGVTDIPEELNHRYRLLAEGLRSCQAVNGLWHTVLNRADYVQETSGSAGIACGFFKGVKNGMLDSSYLDSARLAVSGILPLIAENGEVQGVSGGTPVMPSEEAYNAIEVYPSLYGQGLVMQLLAQALDQGLDQELERKVIVKKTAEGSMAPKIPGKEATANKHETIDQQRLLIRKIQTLESRYNPELHLLRSPFSSPGYHTTLREAEFIHSTRDSLSYALGLLDTELPEYEQRAFDIITQVVSLQDTDRSHDTFGIWSWFYEEPLAQMAPPDWNWADFCGSRLVQALSRHGYRFPQPLRAAVAQSIEYACEAIIKRNVGPDYTNIAILGAFVTRVAGEQLGREDYAEYGLKRLQKLYDYTMERGAFQEYNSPVYTYIAILELSKLRAETMDDSVRALSGELIDLSWRTVAGYYHPATAQWSGPHSRCYETLLNSQGKAFLQLATRGEVMFFDWDQLPYEEEWYRSGFECPAAYLELFTVPATREIRQLYEGSKKDAGSGKWAVTFMTPQVSVGSFTNSDLWNQRRPLLVYADNNGYPSYIQLRCLHDGYDFCSARFKSKQEQGQVLFGIDFITDGGDTHPNLDPTGGAIEAEDLRLRLEIGGRMEDVLAESTEEGAVIRIGEIECVLTTWFAAFTGHEGSRRDWSWEVQKSAEHLLVELVLYAGPRKRIDLTVLRQAAMVFSLDIQQAPQGSNPQITVADGKLRVSCGGDEAEAFSLCLNPGPAEAGAAC